VISNRSIPSSSVIPVLAYPDVVEASEWLCNAFGFKVRLRIGAHRIQLLLGDGAVVVNELHGAAPPPDARAHSVLVRIEDAESHCRHAESHGARILNRPTDYPYGERQYSAEDLGGHRWTFSESIADVDPASWGATSINIA
jgi:uncharacterized glyoxalase superfamily protein PhnB